MNYFIENLEVSEECWIVLNLKERYVEKFDEKWTWIWSTYKIVEDARPFSKIFFSNAASKFPFDSEYCNMNASKIKATKILKKKKTKNC